MLGLRGGHPVSGHKNGLTRVRKLHCYIVQSYFSHLSFARLRRL
jgi:hypothetical protein